VVQSRPRLVGRRRPVLPRPDCSLGHRARTGIGHRASMRPSGGRPVGCVRLTTSHTAPRPRARPPGRRTANAVGRRRGRCRWLDRRPSWRSASFWLRRSTSGHSWSPASADVRSTRWRPSAWCDVQDLWIFNFAIGPRQQRRPTCLYGSHRCRHAVADRRVAGNADRRDRRFADSGTLGVTLSSAPAVMTVVADHRSDRGARLDAARHLRMATLAFPQYRALPCDDRGRGQRAGESDHVALLALAATIGLYCFFVRNRVGSRCRPWSMIRICWHRRGPARSRCAVYAVGDRFVLRCHVGDAYRADAWHRREHLLLLYITAFGAAALRGLRDNLIITFVHGDRHRIATNVIGELAGHPPRAVPAQLLHPGAIHCAGRGLVVRAAGQVGRKRGRGRVRKPASITRSRARCCYRRVAAPSSRWSCACGSAPE